MTKMSAEREAELKAIRKDFDALIADCEKLKSALEKSMKKLGSTLKSGDLETIAKDKEAMEAATKALELHMADDAMAMIQRLYDLPDDVEGAGMSNADLVDKYGDPTYQKNRARCQPTITLARKLEFQAEGRIKAMNFSAKKVDGVLTTLTVNLQRCNKGVAVLKAELNRLEHEAEQAIRWRDEVVLIEAQSKLRELVNLEDDRQVDLKALNETFSKSFLGSQFPADQVKVWQAEFDEYLRELKIPTDELARLKPRIQTLLKLKIESLDAKKAAGVIEVDPKHAAELNKALSGKPGEVAKKLEALAKKVKSKLSAKDMLERLRKARVVSA